VTQQLSHGFRCTVLSHLPEIGYGKTASYAAVAKAAGHPKAVRAGYVKNRVFFADEQTALAAEYRPCAACLPDTHARWKARRG
jgi:hypothetical protein